MALPPGITPKTVTVGIASFFDGSLAEGTATITAPVNVIHTPTNRPIFSSQISKRFVDGEASFDLCPTDAEGLNRKDWTFKLNVVISGALVQPDPIYFTLPAAGPDEIDLDALVPVPSSAGIPISVDVLTTEDLPALVSEAGPFADALRAAFVPPISVDAQAGVNDTAKAQAAIDAAAAAIAAGLGPVEVRFARRNYTWTGTTPTIPSNLIGRLYINGNGAKVTLTASAPALFDMRRLADYDALRNVEITDFEVDAANIGGYGHVIIGTMTYSTTAETFKNRVNVDRVTIRRVRAYNIACDPDGGDYRAGVFFSPYYYATANEQAGYVTNVLIEDVWLNGGRKGLMCGAQVTTSGRVYVDNIVYQRCFHDVGFTQTKFLACTNFFIGGRGHGGKGVIRDCWGRNSGDDGVEFDGMSYALADNVVIEDCMNVAFLHHNFALPRQQAGQEITFRHCRAVVTSALVTSSAGANRDGRGFVCNTKDVFGNTTADLTIASTSITLDTIVNESGEAFFPVFGTVTDGTQRISYTGVDTATKTLTGVTGVTATIPSGTKLRLIRDVGSFTLDGCSMYKEGQGHLVFGGDAFRVNGPVRKVTVRDFDYVAAGWNVAPAANVTPSAFSINAIPAEPGVDPVIRLDNITVRMTGKRTGGSWIDWTAFDLSGNGSPFITATGIVIDNQMTGIQSVTATTGFRFGRLTNGIYTAILKAIKFKGLGDQGAKQRGFWTGTSAAMGNNCLFDISGVDYAGLLTGAVDVFSDSGSQTRYRTTVDRTTGTTVAPTALAPTTGTFQWRNTLMRRGSVLVSGGTVSQIQVGSDPGTLYTTGMTAGLFPVGPGDVVQVVNSVAPTMTFLPFQ